MTNNFQTYLIAFFIGIASLSNAQNASAPVTFKGDTLFIIKNKIGSFSPQQRAEMTRVNIRQLAKLTGSEFDSLKVVDSGAGADISHRKKVIATITPNDADAENQTVNQLAEVRRNIIRQALIDDFNDTSIGTISADIGLFILALIGFLIVLWLVNSAFDYFRRNLKTLQYNVFFRNNRFLKFFELITPETERGILLFLLRMTRFTAIGVFLYFYLPFMFSQISYTRGFGEKLMEYVLRPLRFLTDSFIGFLPNILFISVIIIAVRYLIKGLGYFAIQIKKERIKVDGFFPDWAFPTFNLFRVLIIIFTLVIIFPYLPGSGSDAFQGVSVFIGLLLSLGSAGIISNVISGVI